MNRFVDPTELKQIDLGDGDWVKVPLKLSFNDAQTFSNLSSSDESGAVKAFTKLIREWNLTDKDGKVAEINEENIARLDVQTINKISAPLTSMLSEINDKKKS